MFPPLGREEHQLLTHIPLGWLLLISSVHQLSLSWVSCNKVYTAHCGKIRGILKTLGQEDTLSCLCPRSQWTRSALTTELPIAAPITPSSSEGHPPLGLLFNQTLSLCPFAHLRPSEHLPSFSSDKLHTHT